MRAKKLVRWTVLLSLYAATAGVTLTVFVRGEGLNKYSRASFERMIAGSADRPFVYRCLVPATVRWTASALERLAATTGLDEGETGWAKPGNALMNLTRPSGVDLALSLEYSIWFGLMWLCLVGFAAILRALIQHYYSLPAHVADLTPALALAVIPPIFFRYFSYLYDPATLLTFTLCFYLVVTDRSGRYYLALLIAAFNKETAILALGLFWLHQRGRMGPGRLTAHLVAQAAIVGGVRVILNRWFASNPGVALEFHLVDHNFELLTSPAQLLLCAAAVVPLAILVAYRWSSKPIFLRRGFLLVGLPLLLAAALFGFADELRDYYELYPLVVLLSIPAVAEAFGIDSAAKQQSGF